jgi:hypothetical protein
VTTYVKYFLPLFLTSLFSKGGARGIFIFCHSRPRSGIQEKRYYVPNLTQFNKNALDQLGLEKGTVIYCGRDDFMLTSRIEVKTARTLLLE